MQDFIRLEDRVLGFETFLTILPDCSIFCDKRLNFVIGFILLRAFIADLNFTNQRHDGCLVIIYGILAITL
ncbi:hypothetical protein DDZ16_18405 [Marinilabilia rubra]|uniref:Uncharacterized protein n=1 Tax=Marinilabilia rubra TaxID=2162893 RepID=A0A2U2B4E3_9BACT|nr:hypothetical protein DDZ16_18405 [Marinilabilia rubra]